MIIKFGNNGSLVEMIQLALERAGVFSARKDGIFGPLTRDAVVRFQKRNDLSPDGIVGSRTLDALAPFLTGYIRHTVSPGDTFYKLAKTYSTTVNRISAANPEADVMDLKIGSSLVIPLGFDVVPTDISWSSALNGLVTEGLEARYPFITRYSAGNSVLGRQLYTLKIGSGPVKILYSAAIHANEWLNTPVLLRFIEEYAQMYSTGGKIYGVDAASLFRRTTLYVVPMLDPDGVDLVTGAISAGNIYEHAEDIASSYPSIPFPSGWKANINGTDLNLQFPARWEKAREIKYALGFTSPAPRDFVGHAPLDAPESRALYDLTLNISPTLILAYHSQGEIIYWKYADLEPSRSFEIAQLMSSVSGYPLELTPDVSDSAGFKDWFIQDFDLPGYTIETGTGINPLPLAQFERIYSDNIGILVTGLAQAGH